MNREEYQFELEIALAAAQEASDVILKHYVDFKAIPDAPASISTQADRDSQEVILRRLRAALPEDALCAEEATATLADAVRQGERLWVVDPIDGTRGFAKKNDEFSVMIGFVHQGRIAVGVVQEPAKRRITYATRGGGCWMRDDDVGEPTPCRLRETRALSDAILTQSHSKNTTPMESPIAKLLGVRDVIESYSAGVKLAIVARGEADAYVNTYPSFRDWDTCAGQLLVEEAGGRVTGLKGEELRYGLEGFRQEFGLVASNGLLHDDAVKLLRTL